MNAAFVIDSRDNVATALGPVESGQVVPILGESELDSIAAKEAIRPEHKIALRAIDEGEDILKYGLPIGFARRAIEGGEWVHLHNCASHYDERSSSLDADSGAPTDTEYV